MAKSQHATSYRPVPLLLKKFRQGANLTQRDLAALLKKSQPWVHKSELGERRVDIAEFLDWCMACKVEPIAAVRDLINRKL